MLVCGDIHFDGNIDRTLLRYWSDWMRRMRSYKKHCQRCYERSRSKHTKAELDKVQAEIETLKICIHQIHILRNMPIKSPRKRFLNPPE